MCFSRKLNQFQWEYICIHVQDIWLWFIICLTNFMVLNERKWNRNSLSKRYRKRHSQCSLDRIYKKETKIILICKGNVNVYAYKYVICMYVILHIYDSNNGCELGKQIKRNNTRETIRRTARVRWNPHNDCIVLCCVNMNEPACTCFDFLLCLCFFYIALCCIIPFVPVQYVLFNFPFILLSLFIRPWVPRSLSGRINNYNNNNECCRN